MIKTTVYLGETEAAALRRLAAQSGRSQAEIIRDAVRHATASSEPRRFRSHGAGRGTGQAVGREAEAILAQELGSRRAR